MDVPFNEDVSPSERRTGTQTRVRMQKGLYEIVCLPTGPKPLFLLSSLGQIKQMSRIMSFMK